MNSRLKSLLKPLWTYVKTFPSCNEMMLKKNNQNLSNVFVLIYPNNPGKTGL